MLSAHQVPTWIEQRLYRRMSSNESLRLSHQLESPHPSLSHPGRLMRLFGTIVRIPVSHMDRLRDYLSMSYWIAA
jgi:hypothetical protein